MSGSIVAALIAAVLSVVAAAPASADDITNYTWGCGGELESPCPPLSFFTLDNGNGACDDGLIAAGGTCVNASGAHARYTPEMDTYQSSWAYWAADNQRRELAANEPLNWVMSINSHNSYNNRADGYFAANQQYSITDQLRGGARIVDLDLVWQNNEVRLCHGGPPGSGEEGICSDFDRYYSSAMKEIGAWLDAHPDQVIIVRLEDRFGIDDDVTYRDDDGNLHVTDGTKGNARVNNPIALYLDRFKQQAGTHRVYPASGRSVPPDGIWPSQRELLDEGYQVIVTSGNPRGGQFIWSGDTLGLESQHVDYSACNGTRTVKDAGGNEVTETDDLWTPQQGWWTAVGEDRTLFDGIGAYIGLLNGDRVRSLAQCNTTQISLDMLNASQNTEMTTCLAGLAREGLNACENPDKRVENTIWSWREGDRGNNGDYAVFHASDQRWTSAAGSELHHFACGLPRSGDPSDWPDPKGSDWKVTDVVGPWSEGGEACTAEFGLGYVFGVPVNGYANGRLSSELTSASLRQSFDKTDADVWLNYGRSVDPETPDTWLTRTTTITLLSVPDAPVYDGTPKAAQAHVIPNLSTALITYTGGAGTVYGPTLTPPTAAGNYVATARLPMTDEYLPSDASRTFTVAKAPLTVKVDNKTRTVEQFNPVFTGVVTGVVPGDGITANYVSTATSTSPPGTYPITASLNDPLGRLGNYARTISNGTLTVTPGAPVSILLSPSTASTAAGTPQHYTVTARDVAGSTFDVTPSVQLDIGPIAGGSLTGASCTVGSCTATSAGTYRVIARLSYPGIPLIRLGTLTVVPAEPVGIVVTPATASIIAGASEAYSVSTVDGYGNLTDRSADATVGTVPLDGSSSGVTCPARACSPTIAGSYRVIGVLPNPRSSVPFLADAALTVTPAAPATVLARSGSGQTADEGSAFPGRLTGTVRDTYGNAVPTASVTFRVRSGSGTFPGGASSVSVRTNAAGAAVSPRLAAGASPGPVVVAAASGAGRGPTGAVYLETVARPGSSSADLSVHLDQQSLHGPDKETRVAVTVTNGGPSGSGAYAVAVDVPSGLGLSMAVGAAKYYRTLVYTGAGLASGKTATFVLTVRAANSTGSRVLAEQALATTRDPAPANNRASIRVRFD